MTCEHESLNTEMPKTPEIHLCTQIHRLFINCGCLNVCQRPVLTLLMALIAIFSIISSALKKRNCKIILKKVSGDLNFQKILLNIIITNI